MIIHFRGVSNALHKEHLLEAVIYTKSYRIAKGLGGVRGSELLISEPKVKELLVGC